MAAPSPTSSFEVDLSAWLAPYQGMGRLNRLYYVIKNCTEPLRSQALVLILAELKTTRNTRFYKDIIEEFRDLSQSLVDPTWISETERSTNVALSRLDQRIQEFTAASVSTASASHTSSSELIPLLFEMGDYHLQRGDTTSAEKYYSRIRQLEPSEAQHQEVSLKLWQTFFASRVFGEATFPILTSLRAPETELDMESASSTERGAKGLMPGDGSELVKPPLSKLLVDGKVLVCFGLGYLHARKFELAALQFLQVPYELGDSFNEVVTASDIACFGALCALATFSRAQLKVALLENEGFQLLLSHQPLLKEAIDAYMTARYAIALRSLRIVTELYHVDLFLGPHLCTLLALIRNNAVVNFFVPYSSISLDTMAQALDDNVQDLIQRLLSLIRDGRLSARVDSQHRILQRYQVAERQRTYEECLNVGRQHEESTHALLTRVNARLEHLQVGQQSRSREREFESV
eukprot:CAMPEP_0174239430 /NCGR_PEP_ID=MMETSP0417-20130205/14577_1 /TAXON_ID=242541 /ORGANISM="Mayorella sp, Strain BSH-02190019" /LENGTH=462 /DNA_ID=CAMNT_0015318369 /DNA_START=83 /DNA_END=1467 /DNA_ORIENTATION=+